MYLINSSHSSFFQSDSVFQPCSSFVCPVYGRHVTSSARAVGGSAYHVPSPFGRGVVWSCWVFSGAHRFSLASELVRSLWSFGGVFAFVGVPFGGGSVVVSVGGAPLWFRGRGVLLPF